MTFPRAVKWALGIWLALMLAGYAIRACPHKAPRASWSLMIGQAP